MEKQLDRRWWGVILGILGIGLRAVLGYFPGVVEQTYSRRIFKIIRIVLDGIHWVLPVPGLYLLIVLVIVLIIRRVRKLWKSEGTFIKKSGSFLFSLCGTAGWVIFLFLLLWGFNYGRIPIAAQLKIQPAPLSLEQVTAQLDLLKITLAEARKAIPESTGQHSFSAASFPPQMILKLREDLEVQLLELGYPATGFPTIRTGYPKGIIWRLGAIGFYNPFTGECNVDPAVHPIDQPYVMAHELAHAYGFGDEGTCNFLAYLTCKRSTDPFIRYAGLFNYWQYLYYSYRRAAPQAFEDYHAQLPSGVKTDLISIAKNSALYPDFFPTSFRVATYDAYLRSQGIADGFASYSQVVMLVYAWENKSGSAVD